MSLCQERSELIQPSSEEERREFRLFCLRQSLQALAAPFEAQVRLFPDFVVVADELALNFDQAAEMVRANRDLPLSTDQFEALRAIDASLEAMGGRGGPWGLDDLRESAVWSDLRALAHSALTALGWPVEDPPPLPGTYVQ